MAEKRRAKGEQGGAGGSDVGDGGDGGALQELTFEEAMEEIEGIVTALEGDEVPLADLLERYERGTKLIEVCRQRIGEAEARVEAVVRGSEGVVGTEEFGEGDGDRGGGKGSGDGEVKLL